MADVFTKEKRSQVMSAIRSRGNRDTELKLAMILRGHRITGWRRHAPLPGKPDFIFRTARVAIFVDGCFWHGCPVHGRKPGSNPEYWLPKLARTRQRDRAATRELERRGWRVLRIWEHSLQDERRTVARVRCALASGLVPAVRLRSTAPRP